MSQTKGRAFLLFVATSAPTAALPSSVPAVAVASGVSTSAGFTLIGAALERSVSVVNEAIDGTTAPAAITTPLWQTQIGGAKSVTISASGRFVDDAAEEMMEDIAYSERSFARMLIAYPAANAASVGANPAEAGSIYGRRLLGDFFITNWTASGSLTDTFNWSCEMTSTSAIMRS